MKYILFILIFLTFSNVLLARLNDDNDSLNGENNWLAQVNEFKEEVEKIKKNSVEIYQLLEIYHLSIVEEEFENFNKSVGEAEQLLDELNDSERTDLKNKFYELYESTLDSYNHLMNFSDFYRQLENKKEEWSDNYFNLWEQTYVSKTRMDKMYVKEEKMNVHYGGMSDYKYESVRKRNLYEACTNIFNARLLDLKSTGDCDHYDRIQILNHLLPVMQKCEKLAFEEDTRDLEKELKKEEDSQKMTELILDFEIME